MSYLFQHKLGVVVQYRNSSVQSQSHEKREIWARLGYKARPYLKQANIQNPPPKITTFHPHPNKNNAKGHNLKQVKVTFKCVGKLQLLNQEPEILNELKQNKIKQKKQTFPQIRSP